jgi:predicted nucleotidyltransferase
MNIFVESHQKLLKSLLNHKVNFLLVGGYAVIFHGYKRTTGDMDLWIEPNNENKERLLIALKEFDFNIEDIEHISQLDFTKHLAFHFWEEPGRVDCITYVSNVNFEEAFASKVLADIEGIKIPIIQYQHLIQSKISSERLKDRADVEELQKVNRNKEE